MYAGSEIGRQAICLVACSALTCAVPRPILSTKGLHACLQGLIPSLNEAIFSGIELCGWQVLFKTPPQQLEFLEGELQPVVAYHFVLVPIVRHQCLEPVDNGH